MNYAVPPWKHQIEAIERARRSDQFALFFSMGTGKTSTAINILRHKMVARGNKYMRTVVFCPPIVIPNWREEFLRHSKIPEDRIIMLDGSGKERLKAIEIAGYEGAAARPVFFITNYETLTMGGKRVQRGARMVYEPGPLYEALVKWAPEALVFDESHRLKSHKAQRSIQAARLSTPGRGDRPFVQLLSGSPVLNSPMDLFQQFKVLDGGATFGANYYLFVSRFFYDKNAAMPKDKHFPDWQIKPGALEEMNRLIFRYSMRVTKEECMDLPEEVSVTLKGPLTPAQAKAYKEMKNDFITFVRDRSASATIALVKALKLMQISSGFLSLDGVGDENDRAIATYPKTWKEEALTELLEEITPAHKVIVWAVWKENYGAIRRICEELKLGYVEVHGGISGPKQKDAVERFKTDPSLRVFIGHPGSGGIGINIVCAPYSIFYSRTFSLEHWLQARARNHRGGQREKVTHYDLVAADTIDELVQTKLASKFQLGETLLDQSSLAQALKNQAY